MYLGPRNPRGTSPKVWSPNPTRPWKAEPEPNMTSADPKFYFKNPRKPENLRGTSQKCWSWNPKSRPRTQPDPNFCSPNTSLTLKHFLLRRPRRCRRCRHYGCCWPCWPCPRSWWGLRLPLLFITHFASNSDWINRGLLRFSDYYGSGIMD